MKALRERARQTGIKPAALLTQPRLKPQDHEYMKAFGVLDGFRRMGMSAPDPIPIRDILDYCEMEGIASQAGKSKYVAYIQALDAIYRNHWAEKNNNKP